MTLLLSTYRRQSFGPALIAGALAVVVSACTSGTAPTVGGSSAALHDDEPDAPLFQAQDAIAYVSMLQGVTIPLVVAGEPVASRIGPVVAGRPGLVRVRLTSDALAVGALRVVLEITSPA